MASLFTPSRAPLDLRFLEGKGLRSRPEPQGVEGRKVHEAALEACRHWMRRGEVFLTHGDVPLLVSVYAGESLHYQFADASAAAGREIVAFAQGILRGQAQPASAEMMDLADRAARQCAERDGEDIRAWAEKLAGDVGDCTD